MPEYQTIIDEALKKFLNKQKDYDMYRHMEYFLGFLGESLQESHDSLGKRFRPQLTLLLANNFGGYKKALSTAVSIELFHNFSLIHDDIVDNDLLRRGRKTVWNAFGKNHAINSGDAQLLLSNLALLSDNPLSPEVVVRLQKYLLGKFLEVAEGQYLDFSLEEKSISNSDVNAETYQTMIEKKTAVLIGATAAVAGIVHEQNDEVISKLYNYGLHLGLGYQLQDDYASLWGLESETGKKVLGDLLQKKKTLPILHGYREASDEAKKEIVSFYEEEGLANKENATKVLYLLEKAGSKKYMEQVISEKITELENIRTELNFSKEVDSHLQKLETRLLST